MKNAIVIFVLACLAVVAISPLFVDAWFFAPDSAVHLVRLNDVSYQMADFNFYPRWLSLSCLGKGSPALNFYAPSFYLVTGYLHFLGLSLLTSLRIVCFSCFLAGAWGMFVWMRKHVGPTGAAVAAVVYLFAPYHFLDLYVRGALPEFAALALLPYLFHGLDLSLSDDRRYRGLLVTALSSASIVLTHNLSAFMILPFGLAYFVWRAVAVKAPASRVLAACLGPVIGAGLSAFYWLPVIVESKYLGRLSSVTAGVFRYDRNFLQPSDWFNFHWGYEAFEGPPEGMSYQVGIVLLFCAVLAVAALFSRKGDRKFGMGLLVLGLCALFMTVSYSSFLYSLVSPLAYVQFPWRFLGPATLFLAAFCGFAAELWPLPTNRWYGVAFCGLVVVLCLAFSTSQRKVREQLSVPLDDKEFRMYGQPLFTFATEDEYLPRDARVSVKAVLAGPVQVGGNDVVTRVAHYEKRGARITCSVAGDGNSQLVVPWFYFPGWRASLDGASIPVQASPQGFLAVPLPPGSHTVRVWFGTTWPRVAGWCIAALTVVVCLLQYLVKGKGDVRGDSKG